MHTLLIFAVLAADLTPSDELAQRLADVDARLLAIDERKSNPPVMRLTAGLLYAAGAGGLIWAVVLAGDRSSGIEPRMNPVWLGLGAVMSAGLGLFIHLGANALDRSLEQEVAQLTREREALTHLAPASDGLSAPIPP